MDSDMKRPVLRYYGGKYRMAPWVISHFPKHRVYIEPFGGAASVLMQKPRSYAEIYNDIDAEIVNVFRVLQDVKTAERLFRLLYFTPFARDIFNSAYLKSKDPIEWARRTIVKSFMGHGSDSIHRGSPKGSGFFSRVSKEKAPTGFRGNSNRSGSTPAHDWATYPQQVMTFSERLRGVVIENRPAVHVIEKYDCDDTLIYVDPPYMKSTRRDPYHGYSFEMTDDDHIRLSSVLHGCKGNVIVSGYRCDLYDSLYADFRMVECLVTCQGSIATECLWLSPNISAVIPELF